EMLSPAGRAGYIAAMAARLARQPMGDAAKSLLDNHEFITSMARFSEKLLTEAEVRNRYRLPDDVWEGLGNDEELVSAINAKRAERVRNGACARERAQQLFASAPDVLGGIMNDKDASPRHRIEASKELRTVAANTGPENAPTSDEKFTISIILSADERLVVDKKRGKIDPHDGEIIEHVPQRRREPHDDDENMPLFAVIAATKRDDSDGNPI